MKITQFNFLISAYSAVQKPNVKLQQGKEGNKRKTYTERKDKIRQFLSFEQRQKFNK
jgi:hypothetical protein